jgi:hypothetical protein
MKPEIIDSKELSKLLNGCKRKVVGPGIVKIMR